MKKEDIKEVAEYIADALGKTGINIKLCTGRLNHYTCGIVQEECKKFCRTAFDKNQKSKEEAIDYIAAILTIYGVENPDIWWRN